MEISVSCSTIVFPDCAKYCLFQILYRLEIVVVYGRSFNMAPNAFNVVQVRSVRCIPDNRHALCVRSIECLHCFRLVDAAIIHEQEDVLLVCIDRVSNPFKEFEELGAPLAFRDHAGKGTVKIESAKDGNSAVLTSGINETLGALGLPLAA